MTKYINSAVRLISLLTGAAICGILTLILALCRVLHPWAWGLIAGAVSALLCCLILVLLLRHEERKLFVARSRVKGEVNCFLFAAVRSGPMVRRGYVFLTAERLYIFLWEKRPRLETQLLKKDFTVRYPADEPQRAELVFTDEDVIELFAPSLQELLNAMKQCGYTVLPGAPLLGEGK
jgi:hypothetical protein